MSDMRKGIQICIGGRWSSFIRGDKEFVYVEQEVPAVGESYEARIRWEHVSGLDFFGQIHKVRGEVARQVLKSLSCKFIPEPNDAATPSQKG